MNRAYHLGALKLDSDLELLGLIPWDGPQNTRADVTVRLGMVAPQLERPDTVAPIFQTKGRGEYLLALPGTGRILVQDGRQVTVNPDPAADPIDICAVLSTTVQAVLWHQRGLLPLHACAVSVNGRVLALAGPSACGKSVLAALLSGMGHQVMADDICVVDVQAGAGVRMPPITPHLRLWRDALNRLGIAPEGLRRTLSTKEQFLSEGHDASGREPRALAAVVVLTRLSGGALSIKRLHGALAVRALHDVVHTQRPARALGCDREIFAALARLANEGVRVWRLEIPDDPASLGDAARLALSALEAQG